MSDRQQDLRADLIAAGDLPRGAARSAVIESLVEQADASGDDLVARDGRLELLQSYALGGEPLKRFAPFTWLLNRYDADPDLFGARARYLLFWHFKGVTVGSLSHPAVSLEQIEAGLVDMAERYGAEGEGLGPYLGCRYHVDAHVWGEPGAEESYLAWTRAPRTNLSDCAGCEPTDRVGHLIATSRYGEALSEALPVLENGQLSCSEQPQLMISHALEPLLVLGDPQRAAADHLRGVRILRSIPGQSIAWARHVLICARTGRLMRGLDLLEDRLLEIDDPPTPNDAMWLAAAGARLLAGLEDAGHGELPVTARGGGQKQPSRSVTELRRRLTARARALAAQFDARNDTSTIGDGVEYWLAASELPDLPLDDVLTRRTAPSAKPVGAATNLDSVPVSVPPRSPQDELAVIGAELDASRSSGSAVQRRAALTAWRGLRATIGAESTEQHRALRARLDGALSLDDAETLTEADELVAIDDAATLGLSRAVSQLHAVGEHALAIQYELIRLHRLTPTLGNDPAKLDALIVELDALLADAERQCAPPERGAIHLPAMSILQLAGQQGAPVADRLASVLSTGLDLLQAEGSTLNPHQRACLAILLIHQAAEYEPAEKGSQLQRAFDLLPAGTRAQERALVGIELAGNLADQGDLATAATVLDGVTVDAEVAELPLLAADAWAMRARIHRHHQEVAEAVAAFTRASELIRAADGHPFALGGIQRDQIHALRDAGRSVEAAELAEMAVSDMEEQLAIRSAAAAAGAADASSDEIDALTRVAGTLAFAAALAAHDLGESVRTAELGRRSAAWHRSAGWGLAEAEALKLTAQSEAASAEVLSLFSRAAELFDDGENWQEAARCRRLAAWTALEVDGLQAAQAMLETGRAALDRLTLTASEAPALSWEHLALTEQHTRVLAAADSTAEALVRLEGLDLAYRDLGDERSVRDVVGLRGSILIKLGQTEQGLADLRSAADQALNAGMAAEARGRGGELAQALDALGLPDEAETAWQHYS